MDDRPRGKAIGQERARAAAAAAAADSSSENNSSSSNSSSDAPPPRPVRKRFTRKHIGRERMAAARAEAARRAAADSESNTNNSSNSNSSSSGSSSSSSGSSSSSSGSSSSSSGSSSSSDSNSNNSSNSESVDNIKKTTSGFGIKVAAAENNDTIIEEDEENDDTVIDEEAPQIFAASGDPNLPHILKIGQQGYAEYIDLGSMPTRKEGVNANQFNQFQIGNRLIELQRMYNIIGKENIIAMQRAFGVRSLHQDPPIVKNIVDGCLPGDFKLVQKALQYRIGTLKTRLGLKAQEFSSKSDERRLKWIEDILEKTKGITRTCSEPEKETQTETQTETSAAPSANCACLSDMNLLRDLVYIMSLLQSVTSPEVKKQLEKLTLKRLLASARNSTANPPKSILQDIIEYLENNINSLNSENTSTDQEVLRSIYNSLMKIMDRDEVPEDVTVTIEMILSGLREIWEKMRELQTNLNRGKDAYIGLQMLLDEYSADLEAAQREIEDTRAALDESNEMVQELRGNIQEYMTEVDRLNEFIRRLRGQIEQQTIDYRAAIAELIQFNEEQLTRMEEYYQRVIDSKNRLIAQLTGENEELRQQIGRLTAGIESLRRTIQERDDQIEEMAATVDDERGATEAATAMVEEFQKRLRDCEAEKEGLRARLAAAEAARQAAEGARNEAARERNAATGERNAAARERNAATGERNAATRERDAAAEGLVTAEAEKAALQRDLDELRNRLQTLEGDVGTRQARITTLEAEIADLKRQLQALTTEQQEQRRKCEEDLAAKNREITELTESKDTQIADLQRRLAELTEQLATKDAQLTEKNAQIAADEDEKTRLRDAASAAEATGGEAAKQVADLTGENGRLKTELTRLGKQLEDKIAELAALTAKHDDFKRRLENLLNLLLVDPRLREAAQRFMDGEGDADSPPPELKAPSAEMCTFFQYLTTVVNLQMRKLTSSALSPELKRDILGIYAERREVNTEELLKELTAFFQEVFTHISQSRSVQSEGFTLEGSFPQIATAFGMPVRADLRSGLPKSQIFLNDLGSFGFLSKVVVEPTGVSNMRVKKVQGVGIPTEFVGENRAMTTPLVILGIKYIQLLAAVLNTKYTEIAQQCGVGSPTIAVESEPEEAPPPKPVAPPAPAPPGPVEDYKQRVIDAIKRGRGDFNTASAIGGAITNYTKLVTQKGNPVDKQNYNKYFLEILLGLYKNFYDNQLQTRSPIKLDIPAVSNALNTLGNKPSLTKTLDSIMSQYQALLPVGL